MEAAIILGLDWHDLRISLSPFYYGFGAEIVTKLKSIAYFLFSSCIIQTGLVLIYYFGDIFVNVCVFLS